MSNLDAELKAIIIVIAGLVVMVIVVLAIAHFFGTPAMTSGTVVAMRSLPDPEAGMTYQVLLQNIDENGEEITQWRSVSGVHFRQIAVGDFIRWDDGVLIILRSDADWP